MAFSLEQTERIRQGLSNYQQRPGADGKSLPWEMLKDRLRLSPVTALQASDEFAKGLSAEILRRFVTSRSVLRLSTLSMLRVFLVHEGVLDHADFEEPGGSV
jgi:hypothetical protein